MRDSCQQVRGIHHESGTSPGPHSTTIGLRVAVAVIAAVVALGVIAAPALANTGSVFWDSTQNVAAGASLFNGTVTGGTNVGLGYAVMPFITSGSSNVATGDEALFGVTDGTGNVATGTDALGSDAGGSYNVATGDAALSSNHGDDNIGTGRDALGGNDSGNGNIAIGTEALFGSFTGNYNVATGYQALFNNGSGNHNIASGSLALHANTKGNFNLGMGNNALAENTIGNRNIALGKDAGSNLTTGSDNINIANPGAAGDAHTIKIGTGTNQTKAFIAGIYGNALKGQTVVVNQNGRLGTAPVAAPARSQTLARLREENRRQGDQLHRQSTELQGMRAELGRQGAVIRRLRELVHKGG